MMRGWIQQPVSWGLWLLTCIFLGVAFALAAVFIANSAVNAHDAKTAAQRQVEGRAVAIDVLCGFGNGVAEAGRKALSGQLAGQPSGRGLPAEAQTDYVQTITATLLAEAGITARNVIQPDGEVNCARLRIAAKAQHP